MRIVLAISAALPVLAIAGYAAAGGQSELAEVRQVTARFHDVDAAIEAGYELGYVNGAGTGSSPAASRTRRRARWATTTSTRR